jgi:hypothetical protein
MLPGTAAYTFAGGALSEGGGDLRRTLGYLAIAGVLIVLVSLIPRFLQRRSQAAGELLRSVVVVLAAGRLLASGAEPAAAIRLLPEHNARQDFADVNQVAAICRHLSPDLADAVQSMFITRYPRDPLDLEHDPIFGGKHIRSSCKPTCFGDEVGECHGSRWRHVGQCQYPDPSRRRNSARLSRGRVARQVDPFRVGIEPGDLMDEEIRAAGRLGQILRRPRVAAVDDPTSADVEHAGRGASARRQVIHGHERQGHSRAN